MHRLPLLAVLPLALALAGMGLRADPPAAAPDDPVALKQQLDETQEKLSAALRSYSLLDADHDKLKDLEQKESAELAVLRVQAPLAAQAQALRERVRQLQDEVAALAAENAELKTRLALQAPLPGSPGSAPAGR